VVEPDDVQTKFSWVYDCGSKRTTRVKNEIVSMETWHSWPEEIDLFVLSHLDDDHVNGVERFLRTRRAKCLALPYLDVATRLAQAASVTGDPCSASTALLQLDPIQWLRSNGLSDQVDSILFVRGGRRNPNDDRAEAAPEPLPFSPDWEQRERLAVETSYAADLEDDFRRRLEINQRDPEILSRQHNVPTRVSGLSFELMFFCTQMHKLFRDDGAGGQVANRSGAALAIVQADVNAIMQRYRLSDLSRGPRRGWRAKLREVYDRHFGKHGPERNNISLCLFTRPLGVDVESCAFFEREYDRTADELEIPVFNKASLLCLGDLHVNQDVINEMKDHFGIQRWNSLFAVQVPHHGSTHSWEPGNAVAISPDWFIHCVPDASTSHPHADVQADLHGCHVMRADYRTRVSLNYHFIR
jgi:hypothetical protein